MDAISKLILAFVTLIVGVVLIGSIASEGIDKTSLTSASQTIPVTFINSSDVNVTKAYTVTNYPTGWKVADCPISSFVMTNGSGSVMVDDTDYTLTESSGQFVLKNTALVRTLIPANTTAVAYKYCGDDYMNVSWGRTTINLVPGFFALGILFVSLMLFYSVAKDYDII